MMPAMGRANGNGDSTTVDMEKQRLFMEKKGNYVNMLSWREMDSLTALCDTFLPSVNTPNDAVRMPTVVTADDPTLKFFNTSASMAGTPDYIGGLISQRLRSHVFLTRLALFFLSTWIGTLILCGKSSLSSKYPFFHKFSELDHETRQKIAISWSSSYIKHLRMLFLGIKSLILLAFFTQVRMTKFSRTGHLLALLRDQGSGKISPQNAADIQYNLSNADEANLKRGLEKMLRILAAAGAEEIGTHHTTGPRLNVKTASSHEFERFIKKVSSMGLQAQSAPLASAHQMGSCRMGVEPKTSAVDQRGETWEVEGLYVADTSVFPTALGVNPMVTAMAISYCTAQAVVEVLKRKKMK